MQSLYAILSAGALAITLAVANIFLKLSADSGATSVVQTYTENAGKLFFAMCLYGSVFLIYPIVLKYFPLNVIFPVYTGLTIILVAIAGMVIFDEKLITTQYIGMGLLFLGIILISKNAS